MARRRKSTEEGAVGPGMTDEEAEVGRILGLVARKDPSLYQALKEEAEAKGMSIAEYVLKVIKTGRAYESYADIDGATIMKVMDILDRMQSYMMAWMSKTTSEYLMNQSISTMSVLVQLAKMMAPMLGFKQQEEVEELIRRVREEAKKEVMEEMRRRGIVTDVIDKFVEKVVDEVARAAVEKLAESGTLEELGRLVSGITEETVEEVKRDATIHTGDRQA